MKIPAFMAMQCQMQKPKPANISFSLMQLAAFLSPESCCALEYKAALGCICRLGCAAWGMSAALDSSSMCLKQSHASLRKSALSCPKVFHSSGRARTCCLFDQLHLLHKLIAGSHQCWPMALVAVGITADTRRHSPHQLVSSKAPQRLQS